MLTVSIFSLSDSVTLTVVRLSWEPYTAEKRNKQNASDFMFHHFRTTCFVMTLDSNRNNSHTFPDAKVFLLLGNHTRCGETPGGLVWGQAVTDFYLDRLSKRQTSVMFLFREGREEGWMERAKLSSHREFRVRLQLDTVF